jgi:hypothetical protein
MDLGKLNSATKYPSILTYHEMGDRGRLTQTVQVPFPEGGRIHLTEKVDGTNGRVIVLPGTAPIPHFGDRRYLIGSREELLSAEKDLIYPIDYGIVDALRPLADGILPGHPDLIFVFFFEVYGGDLPASKQYTSCKAVSLRIFDVACVPLDVLGRPIEKIAGWRDHGGQDFLTEEGIDAQVGALVQKGLTVSRVPSVGLASALPATIEATYEWLKFYEQSRCDLGGGKGHSEGVVARTGDRKAIAKMRFEDYERTLGIKRGH